MLPEIPPSPKKRRPRRLRVKCLPLTEELILEWADEHHRRTGRWPGVKAGPIPGSDGDTWMRINHALERGQPGGSSGESLSRFLKRHGRLAPGPSADR